MAIVQTRFSDCYHNLILIYFYNWDILLYFLNLLYFFKCQRVNIFCVFSNLQVSSPKMSQNKLLKMEKMVKSSENGKHKLFVKTYLFNDNPKRLFPSLAMILSLPTAKHRANLMGFKQCLRRTFSK